MQRRKKKKEKRKKEPVFSAPRNFSPLIFHNFYLHQYAIILTITLRMVAIKCKSCLYKVLARLVQYLLRMKNPGSSTLLYPVPGHLSLTRSDLSYVTASGSSNFTASIIFLVFHFSQLFFSMSTHSLSWPRRNSLDLFCKIHGLDEKITSSFSLLLISV